MRILAHNIISKVFLLYLMLKSLEIEQIIQAKRPTLNLTGYPWKVHAELWMQKKVQMAKQLKFISHQNSLS